MNETVTQLQAEIVEAKAEIARLQGRIAQLERGLFDLQLLCGGIEEPPEP
jgi:hypothetical protein